MLIFEVQRIKYSQRLGGLQKILLVSDANPCRLIGLSNLFTKLRFRYIISILISKLYLWFREIFDFSMADEDLSDFSDISLKFILDFEDGNFITGLCSQ